MFELTQTFTHTTGFHITPIEMQGVGFVFIPKELEEQLGYENLSKSIRQSESFIEETEYVILRDSNLLKLKELLNRTNTIGSVQDSIYELLKHSSALIVLTEAGLYTAMFLSRKPNAQSFRRWVTGEVLPSIRKTGMYKLSSVSNESNLSPEIVNRINSLEKRIDLLLDGQKQFQQYLTEQNQFQQYALNGFDRIETVLSESLPHDMFEGWKKIKNLVDDVTKIYNLSNVERKRYLYELCQTHQVQLPEKALSDIESSFYDAREIALKIGLLSANKKPHSRFVIALIRHLKLDLEKYSQKFTVIRRNYHIAVLKYTDKVIPHILEWLNERNYPEIVEIEDKKHKIQKFKVKYLKLKK